MSSAAARQICSVANLTRADGEGFMAVAARVPIRMAIRTYRLEQANEALSNLRGGNLEGAAVLLPADRNIPTRRI